MTNNNRNTCIRCGTCCLAGGFSLMKDDDIERWRTEERDDILRIIENCAPIWAGDRIVFSHRGERGNACPFLEITGEGSSCSIYETRPLVCRNYISGSSQLCPLYKKATLHRTQD